MVGYEGEKISEARKLVAGAFAGCLSRFLTQPLDVIKVRWQLHKKRAGKNFTVLSLGRSILRKEGVPAFWQGHTLGQIAPAAGISFAVFGMVQPLLLQQISHLEGVTSTVDIKDSTAVNLLVASVGAGAVAGIVSKTIVYPLDLVKRRLQIGSHVEATRHGEWWQAGRGGSKKTLVSCNHLATCLWNAYEREGVAGLYRGWWITMLKAQLTSALVFGSYELARRFAANSEST